MTAHHGPAGRPRLWPLLALAATLCACTSPPPAPRAVPADPVPVPAPAPAPSPVAGPALPQYRCEQGLVFTVRIAGDSAVVDAGPRGRELLLRDAGGLTPQQTVYSNQQLRAEFGLGAGNEALLHYATPPLQLRCVRE